MKQQLELVRQFHEKFRVPVLQHASQIPPDRTSLRHELMASEVDEYLEGVKGHDLANVAKELADILYATFGTVLEHGLQDVIEPIFEEVHRSNMSKEFHEYKMRKGPNFSPADLRRFFRNE